MSNKIRELNTIFNSFDLKGSKEEIAYQLSRFEVQSGPFLKTPECEISILWMKNIFLRTMGDFSGAEALLDDALVRITTLSNQDFTRWTLRIYMSLGRIHQEQYNFVDAHFFLSKAYDLAAAHETLNNFIGVTCGRLADIFVHLNQYTKAKQYAARGKASAQTVYQEWKNKGHTENGPAVEYAYSLLDYCRIQRITGLADNYLLPMIEQAIHLFENHHHSKGTLSAKLESAQLLVALNFTDRALIMIQSLIPTFRDHRMHEETITAGLLLAKVHKKMLDYSQADATLIAMVALAREKQLENALVMADVYYEMGRLNYDTDREEKALKFYKSSAKIGMLAGIKQYIFRAFDAARLIDKREAKILLDSDLLYQDDSFIRACMAFQTNPFAGKNRKQKLYASTLFVDIAKFSCLMKASGENTTVQMVEELIDRISMIIFRHHGYIDKFLGDGFMAIFEHGDSMDTKIALNAVRTAMDINRAVHIKNLRFKDVYGLDKKIRLRMGLSTGLIHALFMGNFIKRQFTFLGNAVNLASKLEARADTGELLMDHYTHELVQEKVDTCTRELNLPGFGTTEVFGFKGFKLKS